MADSETFPSRNIPTVKTKVYSNALCMKAFELLREIWSLSNNKFLSSKELNNT